MCVYEAAGECFLSFFSKEEKGENVAKDVHAAYTVEALFFHAFAAGRLPSRV